MSNPARSTNLFRFILNITLKTGAAPGAGACKFGSFHEVYPLPPASCGINEMSPGYLK